MCFNVMCLIIFGKKLIRANVCIMYVSNQNKVFVFVFVYMLSFNKVKKIKKKLKKLTFRF